MNLTVKDVFLALWHSILLIVIVSIIGMVTFGGFTYCFVNPKYTATAKLYVYNEKNDERYITTGDLTVSKSLVDTYLIIIRSDPVLEQVADKLKGTYPELTANQRYDYGKRYQRNRGVLYFGYFAKQANGC